MGITTLAIHLLTSITPSPDLLRIDPVEEVASHQAGAATSERTSAWGGSGVFLAREDGPKHEPQLAAGPQPGVRLFRKCCRPVTGRPTG
jgi:hypothetical protein